MDVFILFAMLLIAINNHFYKQAWQYGVFILNSCLYVMFRSCFESSASVVPIKLVRAAHCGAPRIATHMGICGEKMTGSFQILE